MPDRVELTGWGRTPVAIADVGSLSAVPSLGPDPRGHLARGLGRAYGDAALNSGGSVWLTDRLDSIRLDPASGTAQVGAGVSYLRLLRAALPAGFFPPVTPGTKHVTMGGAIASDVHGKNHHRDGSIRRHVRGLTILTGTGDVLTVKPTHELFAATLGGLGLTGIILEAELDLLPVASSAMTVETKRTANLAETLDVLRRADRSHRYTVAWVDLAASGRALGRGLVDAGEHAPESETPPKPPVSARLTAPRGVPSGLVNETTVRLFNRLWYSRAPAEQRSQRSIDSFFYPLDAINEWNRIYGKRGFVQYQFVVPEGSETVLENVAHLVGRSSAPALAVLKKFGEGGGLLSFPMRGWTLAVDIPAAGNELAGILDEADRRVAAAGGRIYLAKDARMQPGLLPTMYPELEKWRHIADRYDPDHLFRSDLDRRLGLRSHR